MFSRLFSQICSKILAMVSEDPNVRLILEQLLGGSATQFRLVRADTVVAPGVSLSFEALAEHCRVARGATLVGFIPPPVAKATKGGPPVSLKQRCVVNPDKKGAPHSWEGHRLVLIVTEEAPPPASAAAAAGAGAGTGGAGAVGAGDGSHNV